MFIFHGGACILEQVRKHASEYHSQVEALELAKREVKKEFEEVRAKKQELKIWQREAEETLQNRIDSFIKGKEELTAQIKELVMLLYIYIVYLNFLTF